MSAWHNIYIHSDGNGGASVYESTNDDNDDGIDDGEVVDWHYGYPGPDGLEKLLKRVGVSRTGISGVEVSVFLDDEKI